MIRIYKASHALPFLLLTVSILSACSPDPYKDYKRFQDGLYYRLISIGDEQQKMNVGDYLTGYINIQSLEGDTLFFQPSKVTFQLHRKTEFDVIFSEFNIGDSVSAIWKKEASQISFSSLNVFLDEAMPNQFRVDFRITKSQSQKEYMKDSLFYIEQGKLSERFVLHQYLAEHQLSPSDNYKGIFYVPIHSEKEGEKVSKGQTVRVEYIARFLDGRIFDATKKWKEAFIFEYGRPLQLIKGLEIALSCMKEGEVAKIILPSQLAFGEIGSSTGTVPPYTAVVYQLKLAEIY